MNCENLIITNMIKIKENAEIIADGMGIKKNNG